MNSNQLQNKNYLLLPIQTQLLEAGADNERVSLLPPLNKLQLKAIKKRLFVKSVPDPYQYLRIMVFGLFMQAHTRKPNLLNNIKRVIYGGFKDNDSTPQNHKLVKLINQIPLNDTINTERAIINIFVHTLDSKIINPFTELMAQQQKNYETADQCKLWIQDYFGVIIDILKMEEVMTQNICFYDDQQSLMKISLQNSNIYNGLSIAPNVQTSTSSLLHKNNLTLHQKSSQIQDLSSTKQSIRLSGLSHHVHFQVDQSFNDNSAQRTSIKVHKPQKIQSQHARPKQPHSDKFSLWEYFCC